MGDPPFKIRDLIKRENITLFSSNYALYGDLIRRVGDCLASMVPTVETYSIDESFLNLGEFNEREVEPFACELRERVHRWVGIPTCVGIAPTKTLAKVANFIAKKRLQYATRAAEKMRRYKVAAENIFVFMPTNTFNKDPFYSNGASARFVETTNDTGQMVALAVRLGERLWKDGFRYSKCGVMITELLPETVRQPALWGELDRERVW